MGSTLELLEEKENFLQKKITTEVERAKEFAKAKNKQAALQCLKRKKFYEGQMEHLGSFQLRIHTQVTTCLQDSTYVLELYEMEYSWEGYFCCSQMSPY
ncbi:hypothetical protein ACLOJK_037235 [Asimina triloba]